MDRRWNTLEQEVEQAGRHWNTGTSRWTWMPENFDQVDAEIAELF